MLCLSVLSMQMWAQSPAATPGGSTTTQAGGSSDLNELRDRIAKQEAEIKQLQRSNARCWMLR